MRVVMFLTSALLAMGCYRSHLGGRDDAGPLDATATDDASSDFDSAMPSDDADVPDLDSGLPGVMPSCAGSEDRCVFDRGSDIRALAILGDRLYWLEYGTFDELENYRRDGRVRSRRLDGTDPTTHLEGLDGPMSLAVTNTHVFVRFSSEALVRFARADGEVEMLDNRARLTGANEEIATWLSLDNVLWAAGAGSKFVLDRRVSSEDVAVIGDFAFFLAHGELRRASVRDGHDPPIDTWRPDLHAVRGLTGHGGELYVGRQGESTFVARWDPSSGSFENVARASFTSLRPDRLVVVGDRYGIGVLSGRHLLAGRLDPDETGAEVMRETRVWTAAEPGIYTTANWDIFDEDVILHIPW